jgi:hypothetical protein
MWTGDTKGERPNLACDGKTDPEVHIGHVVFGEVAEFNLDSVQVVALTQHQQMVHELPDGIYWS